MVTPAPGRRRRVTVSAPAMQTCRGRRPAVFLVKAVHTAVFAGVSGSILHVFWAGVLDRPSRWTAPAIVAVLAEIAVFLGNRGRCPLTGLAEQLGAEHGRVSDIFLPRWFADRIPYIYTPPFFIGLAALVWRRRGNRGGQRG